MKNVAWGKGFFGRPLMWDDLREFRGFGTVVIDLIDACIWKIIGFDRKDCILWATIIEALIFNSSLTGTRHHENLQILRLIA